MSDKLTELLERVRNATGPDRGIDRAIAYHLGVGVEKERKLYEEIGDAAWVKDKEGLTPYDKARGDRVRQVWEKGTRRNPGKYVPQRMYVFDGPMPLTDCAPVSTSVDAALALAEQVLPGIWYVLAKGRMTAAEPLYGCELLFGHDTQVAIAEGATQPLAILTATLSALSSLKGRVL